MNEMRKLMEAVEGFEFSGYVDDDEEEIRQQEERYNLKGAEIEKFEGRKIFVTDLYDGDVYGILDEKHGPRFMLSAPLWRGFDAAPEDVTADEIEISSPTFDIDQNDEDFLRRWYLNDVLGESVEIISEGRQFVSAAAMVRWMLSTLERIKYHYSYVEGGDEGKILHYDNVINEIDDLITEMRDAEVNPDLAKGRSRRVPGRGH